MGITTATKWVVGDIITHLLSPPNPPSIWVVWDINLLTKSPSENLNPLALQVPLPWESRKGLGVHGPVAVVSLGVIFSSIT